ncbi:DUF3967 domain-containing protein [Bacillus thuringiensis]|uniref:DUF3967 domain-containing protein n=1 Tax=Bacillus thuringiensis TaxID=1428 RepID=UPI00119ED1CE|nr:DUF3967 domain-containing protein [Bacillus thuringiensis]
MHVVSSQKGMFSTTDVAKALGISTETIRKYNSLFYAHNVRFIKVKGKIRYSEQDLQLFKQLQKLHSTSGMALVDCVTEVTKHIAQDTDVSSSQTTQIPVEWEQIQQQMKQLQQENKKLCEEFNGLKSYVDEKLEKRDEQLTSTIREIQEQKRIMQEIAATQKKKWWQFWRK